MRRQHGLELRGTVDSRRADQRGAVRVEHAERAVARDAVGQRPVRYICRAGDEPLAAPVRHPFLDHRLDDNGALRQRGGGEEQRGESKQERSGAKHAPVLARSRYARCNATG